MILPLTTRIGKAAPLSLGNSFSPLHSAPLARLTTHLALSVVYQVKAAFPRDAQAASLFLNDSLL